MNSVLETLFSLKETFPGLMLNPYYETFLLDEVYHFHAAEKTYTCAATKKGLPSSQRYTKMKDELNGSNLETVNIFNELNNFCASCLTHLDKYFLYNVSNIDASLLKEYNKLNLNTLNGFFNLFKQLETYLSSFKEITFNSLNDVVNFYTNEGNFIDLSNYDVIFKFFIEYADLINAPVFLQAEKIIKFNVLEAETFIKDKSSSVEFNEALFKIFFIEKESKNIFEKVLNLKTDSKAYSLLTFFKKEVRTREDVLVPFSLGLFETAFTSNRPQYSKHFLNTVFPYPNVRMLKIFYRRSNFSSSFIKVPKLLVYMPEAAFVYNKPYAYFQEENHSDSVVETFKVLLEDAQDVKKAKECLKQALLLES